MIIGCHNTNFVYINIWIGVNKKCFYLFCIQPLHTKTQRNLMKVKGALMKSCDA